MLISYRKLKLWNDKIVNETLESSTFEQNTGILTPPKIIHVHVYTM